jgi:hypothetical protein
VGIQKYNSKLKKMENKITKANLTFAQSSMVIESIYKSEIPCRIEWMFDSGFIWSIQNSQLYPRLFIDNSIGDEKENIKILSETPENMFLRNNPFIEKDWIARGNNYSFLQAVNELAEKVCELYPESELASWFIIENRKQY